MLSIFLTVALPSPANAVALPSSSSRFGVRMVGSAETAEELEGVIKYTLSFAEDGLGEWTITRRYSKWRRLYEKVGARWPHALARPTALSFPAKALPAFLLRASAGLVSERASGIE